MTALLLLGALAMGRVLANTWVQDEGPLLLQNFRIHEWSGVWSGFALPWWPAPSTGGLYRPLAQSLSTMVWMIGDGSGGAFKLASLLCYLVAIAGVWMLMKRLLPPTPAWLATALFAVHPVHTEAVAVAVNLGESLVTALITVAAAWWLDWLDGKRPPRQVFAVVGLAYLVALGFKEHALVLPVLLAAIVPLRTGAVPLRRALTAAASVALVGVVFVVARTLVLGGAVNAEPAHGLPVDAGPRLLTMLGVVPEWARLLAWPAQLQADYAPLELQPWSGWTTAHTLGVLLLAAGIGALAWSWKRRPTMALALIWIAVALFPVSNTVVVTGILLAERTLMLASVGAVLCALAAVPTAAWGAPLVRTPVSVVVGGLVLLGLLRSAVRFPAFRDQDAYVTALSHDAPRSWHTLAAAGTLALEQGDRRGGEERLRAVIAIAPWHSRAYRLLGRSYRLDGLCVPAIPLLERTIEIEPVDQYSRLSLVACLLDQARYPEARRVAEEGAQGPGAELRAAFAGAAQVADSAAATGAPAGVVRLPPFPGGHTLIGTAIPPAPR